MSDKYMSPREAQQRLHHPINYIYELYHSGQIEGKRVGHRILLERASVERRAEERGR